MTLLGMISCRDAHPRFGQVPPRPLTLPRRCPVSRVRGQLWVTLFTRPVCAGRPRAAVRFMQRSDPPSSGLNLSSRLRSMHRAAKGCAGLVLVEQPKDVLERQAVRLAGAVWGAEQRRLEGGARSALRLLTHGNCLSAASEANGASFAVRPRGEQRRAVGRQGRPPHPAPARCTACRDARRIEREAFDKSSRGLGERPPMAGNRC